MKKNILVTILLIVILVGPGLSQDTKVVRDFRFHGKLGVTKELFDSWKIGMQTVVKLEENASRLDEIDLDFDINYKPHSIINFGVGYRLAANYKKDKTVVKQHRLYGETELNYKLDRFKFEFRIRYQNVDDDFFQYSETTPAEHILRNRLQLKYDIPKSKLTPYISAELYGQFGEDTEFPLKMKYIIGVRYSFGKYGKIRVYYRLDRELNSDYPFTFHTLGVGYRYYF